MAHKLGALLLCSDNQRLPKNGKQNWGPNQTGTNQTGTNQTGTNQTGTNQTGTNQIVWLVTIVLLFFSVQAKNAVANEAEQVQTITATVVLVSSPDTCVSQEAIDTIATDMDDLPATFQIISQEAIFQPSEKQSEPLSVVNAAIQYIKKEEAAAIIWFSCESSTLHMVTQLANFPNRNRTLKQEDEDFCVEAATAVIRNWIEAVVPKWQSSHPPSKETPTPPPPEEIDSPDLEELLPPRNALLARTWPSLLNVEIGLHTTIIDTNAVVPGGYGIIGFRSKNRSVVQFGIAVFAPAESEYNSVKMALRKHPITIGFKKLIVGEHVVGEVGGGFEIDVFKRDIQVDNQNESSKNLVQTAFFLASGFSRHLFSSVCLVLHGGIRVLITQPVFEVAVGTTKYTVHEPWRIQPFIGAGIRIGIF